MSRQDRFIVATGSAFTPFWRRLPKFFLYPFQAGSIMRIVGYSVFGGIALFIPPLFGTLLQLVLWIVFLKYAFLVMDRTANGQFDEPNDISGTEGDASQVLRQFGLLVIFGLMFGLLAYQLGQVGYGIGWIMMNLLPPAGIMIIAVNPSLFAALNPFQILF